MDLKRHFIFGLAMLVWIHGQPLLAGPGPGENPFAPIIARNVFGLQPIATNSPANPILAVALPKITPNGIMTIFGIRQVLFKVVATSISGETTPNEQSYILSEGDQQDGIEVQKIDYQSSTITFNNHGVIQELPLLYGNASGGNLPSVSGIGTSATYASERAATIRERVAKLRQDNYNSQNFQSDLPVVQNDGDLGAFSPVVNVNAVEAQQSDYRQNVNPRTPVHQLVSIAPQTISYGGDTSTPPDGGDVPPPPPRDGY